MHDTVLPSNQPPGTALFSARASRGLGICLALLYLPLAGCSTSRLQAARKDFYQGRNEQASAHLVELPSDQTDRVLLLMERGMIHHAAQEHEEAVRDWNAASELIEALDYYSVSRGATSFVVNDRVMAFRGAPYERTLLRAFAALSYFALGKWEDAAVEARNIIYRAEHLDGFPDDAYSRYLAGFCLELVGEHDAAALQYRTAAGLLSNIHIDELSGKLAPRGTASSPRPTPGEAELVCFVAIGRSPSGYGESRAAWQWGSDPHVEFFCGSRRLGRSHTFTDVGQLLSATEQRQAAIKAAKQTTRIVLKEVAAQAVSRENDALGQLLRVILFSLEAAGVRRWETLPRWLQVFRAPCPADLKEFRAVFHGQGGRVMATKVVTTPLTHRGQIFVSFCRGL